MKYSEGLVLISSRSSYACVEGRARQGEQLGSLRYGRMATWPELVRLLRQRGLCRVDELVRVSSWAHGAVAGWHRVKDRSV